jgi:malonyl-CoA O-methyltransferase
MWWKRNIPKKISPLEGYNRWAERYDHEQNPIKQLSDKFVERHLPDLRHAIFLDCGCGPGKFLQLAQQQHAGQVHGIDLSPEMIRLVLSKCPGAILRCADLTQTSLEKNTFDVVVCALVMGHIDNLPVVLGKLLDALNDNGVLILTDFHPYLTLLNSKRTFFDPKSRRHFEITHHLHLLQDYFKIFQKNAVTIEVFEEPLYEGKPVIFGIRAKK